MLDSPLVSIIMPAYNAAQYISESIQSVIDQTYTNWELIVIDDGSTDETAEIVKNCAAKETRILYLYQENGKQGKARNFGINKSSGEYIAFLDADDLWVTDKLEIQAKYLLEHPNIDLVFSQGYFLEVGGNRNFDVLIKESWTIDDFPLFIENNRIPILSVILKRAKLIIVDCFEENIEIQNVEDYHLWMKLLLHHCIFASIPNRLFYYRIHPEQQTYNNNNVSIQIIKMFRQLYENQDLIKWRKNIIERIKWALFNQNTFLETRALIQEIIMPDTTLLLTLSKASTAILPPFIDMKLQFKLFSWFKNQ